MSGEPNSSVECPNPMDKLLAKLSEQSAAISKQTEALKEDNAAYLRTVDYISASSSVPLTPAEESFNQSTALTTSPPSLAGDGQGADEVLRLKLELEAAKGKIARMDQELAQSRITKHTIDQAIGSASEADYPMTDSRFHHLPTGVNPASRPQPHRDNSWAAQDDARSDTSDALSATGFNRARAIWNNGDKPNFPAFQQGSMQGSFQQPSGGLADAQYTSRSFGQPFVDAPEQYAAPPPPFREQSMVPDHDMLMAPPAPRRPNAGPRFNHRNVESLPYAGSNSSYDGYTPNSTAFGSFAGMGSSIGMGMNMGSGMTGGMATGMHGGMFGGYQPQPVGTPLSPHAPEFNASGSMWKNEASESSFVRSIQLLTWVQAVATEGQTYLPTTEPLNYRRLLDRTVNCNWKYIVDKIVCNNDQQASIFLQQKLKVGTTEQKFDIVEAIVAQAYPLMVNRFGNFLVQRCFEHGTPEQVIKIAESIRGNTLNLSMDAFGCHVVQKAFDSVPEDYKAIMVHELLRRIPETVIHRYACHVWQKLFELRWSESPPQIMKYVNDALRGMWHEVALGETGSLVVQNIFENCLEEDKVGSLQSTSQDITDMNSAPLH